MTTDNKSKSTIGMLDNPKLQALMNMTRDMIETHGKDKFWELLQPAMVLAVYEKQPGAEAAARFFAGVLDKPVPVFEFTVVAGPPPENMDVKE